jgi:hypothetical protein
MSVHGRRKGLLTTKTPRPPRTEREVAMAFLGAWCLGGDPDLLNAKTI